ncbi:helix-turn-helix domain-containing protein [Frigoriflavimonas asaccharolytica]|uniref:AraC-like DNA-binding protein n=1 Tax=Frigoriflavimonas asaccharolytica TaxID=2735899 RepID=A0A8J8K786_9FLAO|nr:AraC family transcriptional regulator [Frigoriflavimonas asaccharolytica]NRS91246.1 AraC-like DNA-binding protein [Frigoriflavimonas asaccharolytica]
MPTFQVQSIPLKDVIISLAKSFNVPYQHSCNEHFLEIPAKFGGGEIRGINFDNGLGLIVYNVSFKEDIRLEFTIDEVHPIKFIYSLQGSLSHLFADQEEIHSIPEYSCAIVASEKNGGHIVEFKKDISYEVVSIEIDRKVFSERVHCEIDDWNSKLQDLFLDLEGKKQFYHLGSCGVYFKDILQDFEKYKDFLLARKLNLQSITLQMFINQLAQFDDDLANDSDRTILRIDELKRVEEIAKFVQKNLAADLSIKNLAKKSGLNPNKLQNGFKHLYSTTVNEFVTNTRLEKSNILLKNKEYNVSAVVAAIGLESNSYFSKIYKKKFGITPKNYKKLFV